MLYDFIQVLHSTMKYPTKIEHFYNHIIFSTIYLLREQKINHNKYFEQERNMSNFTYANDHDVHMYAKIQGLKLDGFFVIKYFKF
jgi:hypothetical protein